MKNAHRIITKENGTVPLGMLWLPSNKVKKMNSVFFFLFLLKFLILYFMRKCTRGLPATRGKMMDKGVLNVFFF